MNLHGSTPTANARTLEVYEQMASRYATDTGTLDTSVWRAWLSDRLPPGASILDAGCGWGRDARAFLDQGFDVQAFDGCPAMAAMATRHLGRPVAVQRFQDLAASGGPAGRFDGLWARASLLHLPPDELVEAWAGLVRLLRPEGWAYLSFKHGPGERWDAQGRYYLDMDEERFRALLAHGDTAVDLVRAEVSPDAFGRPEPWLHLLVRKTNAHPCTPVARPTGPG